MSITNPTNRRFYRWGTRDSVQMRIRMYRVTNEDVLEFIENTVVSALEECLWPRTESMRGFVSWLGCG